MYVRMTGWAAEVGFRRQRRARTPCRLCGMVIGNGRVRRSLHHGSRRRVVVWSRVSSRLVRSFARRSSMSDANGRGRGATAWAQSHNQTGMSWIRKAQPLEPGTSRPFPGHQPPCGRVRSETITNTARSRTTVPAAGVCANRASNQLAHGGPVARASLQYAAATGLSRSMSIELLVQPARRHRLAATSRCSKYRTHGRAVAPWNATTAPVHNRRATAGATRQAASYTQRHHRKARAGQFAAKPGRLNRPIIREAPPARAVWCIMGQSRAPAASSASRPDCARPTSDGGTLLP